MDQKQVVASLLAKANKYRNFARWIGDRQTVQSILALIVELKQRARALARPDEDKIRRRAREIWTETANRPGEMLSFGSRQSANFARRKRLPRKSERTFDGRRCGAGIGAKIAIRQPLDCPPKGLAHR
jgi:hypothetical protein